MLVIYFIGILLPAVFNKAFGSHMDNNLFQSHVGYYLLPMIFYFMNNLWKYLVEVTKNQS